MLAEVGNGFNQVVAVDAAAQVADRMLACKHADKIIPEHFAELVAENYVARCFVGKDKLDPTEFIMKIQIANDSNEGRNARSAGDKNARPFIPNGSEHIVQNQLAACIGLPELACNAITLRINFNGELQVIPFVQSCKCKRAELIFPFRQVNAYICCLPGNEIVSLRTFYFESFYIMCYKIRFQNLYNM